MNILGAFLAFLVGTGIALICYAISKKALKTGTGAFAATQIARQVIQLTYLVIVFLLSRFTPFDMLWLLVGACLGMTLPMIYLTRRLIKLNDEMKDKEENRDG